MTDYFLFQGVPKTILIQGDYEGSFLSKTKTMKPEKTLQEDLYETELQLKDLGCRASG